MKFNYIWAIGIALISLSARAESFSLTRDDGKVFFCTDNPSNPLPTTYTVNQCDCKYSVTSGIDGVALWFGSTTPSTECKTITNLSKPFGCKTISVPNTKNILCDCKYSETSSVDGEAMVYPGSESAAKQCKAVSNLSKPFNCRVAP